MKLSYHNDSTTLIISGDDGANHLAVEMGIGDTFIVVYEDKRRIITVREGKIVMETIKQ